MKNASRKISISGHGFGIEEPLPCYRGPLKILSPWFEREQSEAPAGKECPITEIQKILVPLELDDRAALLLKAAAAMAEQLDAQLFVLYVRELTAYAPASTSPRLFKEWNDIAQKQAEERLGEFLARFGNFRIRIAQSKVTSGLLEDEILKAAEETGSNLILLSTHAYRGIKHALLGSKAEFVLRHARCPVLVVPIADDPPAAKRKEKSKKEPVSSKAG